MNDPKSRKDKFLNNLGTKTRYSLSQDSLKVFNLSENRWDAYKLKSLKADSLIIEFKGVPNIFIKRHFNLDTIPDYDAVVVASTPCFGICPIFEIIVTKEGKVSYHGEEYLKNEGHYTSHISKSEFKNIMTRFKQANYMNLKKEYFTMVTDCATVYTTFIKNGKVVQSISDYAASSPPEFVYAYNSLFNLEQKMEVSAREVPDYLYNDEIYYASLKGRKNVHLTTSETFYIINSLVEGKETNKTFKEEYTITYSNKLLENIKTDGRYYKIYLKDGTTKTIDVGRNLLEGSNFCELE
ncbi:hypothetical protein GCM10007424_05060 [Flavobacterium suaedae]|uniref:DUF6438 domain-containing protein n=1 Tax=Flavobacterium suaedae TaxID=1767027 RepID=A0ABQ1JIL5_9FLAO|nr:DUF6438 domain-containing protein [Flavobacterium suaedae]GGB68055.1 hypothetical protein GCM10007424_05060 [Flavobacterium suaedae]